MAQEKKVNKVKPQEPVKVYMSASKFHTENQEVTMHRALAEKMVNSGKASYEPTAGSSKTEDKEPEI